MQFPAPLKIVISPAFVLFNIFLGLLSQDGLCCTLFPYNAYMLLNIAILLPGSPGLLKAPVTWNVILLIDCVPIHRTALHMGQQNKTMFKAKDLLSKSQKLLTRSLNFESHMSSFNASEQWLGREDGC